MPTSSYSALWDRKAQVQDQIEAFLADTSGRALTPDEEVQADGLTAQIQKLDGDIRREEALRAAVAAAPSNPRISVGRDLGLSKPWGFQTFGATLQDFVSRKPTAFLAPDHPMHPRNVYQNAADGEFLQAVFLAAKGRGMDPRLTFEAAAQGAGEFVGADGGFLVPQQSADRLLLRMTGGEILSRVQKQTLTNGNSIDINVIDETDRATGSRHGAVRGYRLDEGTAITASRPKMAKLQFKLHKYAALGYATDELLADASLVGRLIFDAFGDELKFMAEDDVVNGAGAGAPQGILNANALVTISKETGQVATTIVYDNILKMWSRCYAPCRANCVWLINQDTEPQLYKMALNVGTGGVPVYMPASGAAGLPYSTLFGRPVVPVEYCATLGTVGDIILTDLSQYWLFDQGLPQQASSIHVAFTTDEQAFRVTYRVDGRCSWIAPLTPFKGTANTRSCCVALATRA